MAEKKELTMTSKPAARDPFALLRQMTSELDRVFDEPLFPAFKWPAFRALETQAWLPKVDVFEKDKRLVTRVDLPGMKKEDITVEVTEGRLALSGERRHDKEEQKDNVYRREREYGGFYRVVPLPEGAKIEDMKATFADGVLEVSVPLPARVEPKLRKIDIEEPGNGPKAA